MSLNLTMNRAFGLLEDNIRQKQENFQETMRSKETMERLRQETLLEKQRLTNQGGSNVAQIRAKGDINRQGVANEGLLGQQRLRNIGDVQTQTLRNQGGLAEQGLRNQGQLAVENRRQTGATNRHSTTEQGLNKRFDRKHALEQREHADTNQRENRRLTLDQFTGMNETGGMLNQSEDKFFENVDKFRFLSANPDQKKRLAERMRTLGY